MQNAMSIDCDAYCLLHGAKEKEVDDTDDYGIELWACVPLRRAVLSLWKLRSNLKETHHALHQQTK
jgi:hypothetical protein